MRELNTPSGYNRSLYPLQEIALYWATIATATVNDMTTTVTRTAIVAPARFAHVPPNWFAAVMGTGIISVAAHALVDRAAVFGAVSIVFWLLACVIFTSVVAATAVHWLAHPAAARGHHTHSVIVHFYGAVPMATLTVGTSTLVAGTSLIGHDAALAVDLVCFTVGTVGGVVTAIVIPLRHLRRDGRGDAFGGWLMSVVPPMVSASAAAVLAGAVTGTRARETLLVVGVAAFTLSLALSAPIIAAIGRRLFTNGVGPAALVPTWWIVLGPLGQSVTAACLLSHNSAGVLDAPTARVVHDLALGYAIPVWILAVVWIVLSAAITAHTARRGLPFALTWWSFIFPVGTFVTGSAALALVDGWVGFTVAALISFGALVVAWLVVAARTVAGVVDGSLLAAPARGTLER